MSVCVFLGECVSVRAVISSHLESLNGSVDNNLFSWMAIAKRSDENHSLSSRRSKPNKHCHTWAMCVCVLNIFHAFINGYIGCSLQMRGAAGKLLVVLLPSLSSELYMLCVSQTSGGGGVQITVGLHDQF